MAYDVRGAIRVHAGPLQRSDMNTVGPLTLLEACKLENMTHILFDCREASSHSTVLDVWTLARDLGSVGVTPENRVAVLTRPKDNFDRAAFLELCATNRGYQLKAFREFEEALPG